MCDEELMKMLYDNKSVGGRSDDILDRTMPPKVSKVVKTLALPDFDKWKGYDRAFIVPFTLNPADNSGKATYWDNLSTKGKRQRIIRFFRDYKDIFSDYYITYEFGDKSGRFHAHGMLYIKKGNKVDYHYFVENIRKEFGGRKYKKACYKGTPMKSHKLEAFEKCYNYTTKDINVMYTSRYKIKWTGYDDIVKIRKKKIKLNFFAKSLDPPENE